MFICTYTPHKHGQGPSSLRRGHPHVLHDGKVWEYHVPRSERRAFRQFLVEKFGYRGETVKVEGSYPLYHITTR
jgi:hypothetical protein